MTFLTLFQGLREHKVRRYAGIAAAVTAAILAVTIVSTLAIDLGPAVHALAEREATRQLQRPVHLGPLRILVARGVVEVRDFSIEGLHPADRPFLTATRLLISLDWSKAIARQPEFIITSVDLTDWRMLVEKWEDEDNFPKIPRNENPSNGPPRTTTTLNYLRAWRGQFTYEDHESPWSVVAPNVDLTISKHDKYEGDATVDGATVSIQEFVPMWTNMKAHFVIDGPILHMTRIDLDSDGAKTVAVGDVDVAHFPEMSYAVKSHLQTPRMREIFFKDESWKLSGDADFAGTFHLFSSGHDLAGRFTAPVFGVNDYRFPSLYGQLHWTSHGFEIWNAGSQLYGGTGKFAFSTKPLGTPERALDRFELTYTDVDLARFTDFEQLAGQRFAGAASGRNVIEWHSGAFTEEHHGDGEITITPPAGAIDLMTASLASERAADAGHALHEWGPFAPMPLPAHLPIAAAMRYRYDPAEIRMDGGRFATESTFVTFQGTTAWGTQGHMPFHVTSRDWQESDELLAGIITDVGSRKTAVAVGGRGEFDGVFTGPFEDPRVEGDVRGEDMRAWDTLWGEGNAHIVVEHDYVTVADGIVRRDGSEIRTEGKFSLGYPRDDDGEEIDARFRAAGRDIDSLRHAFEIDDYPVSGALTGEFHLTGPYQHMVGFGAMTIDRGIAYGEPFEQATASLRFDGAGVRLDGGTLLKGSGVVNGAAYVGWDSTYSFNADARGIPVDRVAMFRYPAAPAGGLIDFTAGGSGNVNAPRYDVRFRVSDLSVGDEPVGQVTGTFGVRGKELSGEFDAASPRLAMTGTGRMALTPQADSEMTVRFHDLSLDPYIRLFVPKLSPYNSAVATGSLRVVGELADLDHLLVDGTVDSLDMRLFDYAVKNAGPMKIALDHRIVRIDDLELVGEDTRLRVGGTVSLRDEQIALQAAGDANLGILQGFFRNVRGSGRAELAAALNGPMRDPVLSGSARITNGRIRHFALPNSLDAINGTIQFDSRGIRLDDLSATMGDGHVQFGGRIGIDGYLPGDLNVTVVGENMHLRVPEGVRSTIDADLAIRGNVKAPTLGGTIVVKSATLTSRIDPTGSLFDFGGRTLSTGRRRHSRCRPRRVVSPAVRRRPARPFDAQGREQPVPSRGERGSAVARHLRSPAVVRPRRRGSRRDAVRRPPLHGHEGHGRLHQPGAHRAVFRRRGRDERARAGRNLPHHDSRDGDDGAAPADDRFRSAAADGRRARAALWRREPEPEQPDRAQQRRGECPEESQRAPAGHPDDARHAAPHEPHVLASGPRRRADVWRRHVPALAIALRHLRSDGAQPREPGRARHHRQAHLGPRLPDVLAKPHLHHQRSDHSSRVRRERSVFVDSVAERRPDVRARGQGEAHLLMRLWVLGVLVALGTMSLVVLMPGAARADVGDYVGKPIASIRVELEAREVTDPKLLQIIEMKAGAPLSMVAVRETVSRLFALGRFEDVRVLATAVAGAGAGGGVAAVALVYDLVPVHPVEKIDFTGSLGAPGVDTGRLRREVVGRFGASPPVGRAPELVRVIEDDLHAEGYLHPTVTPRAELRHAPDRATLIFAIDPGPRTRIADVTITGSSGLPDAELLKLLGVSAGAPYRSDDIASRTVRYVDGRRSRGYFAATLTPEVTFGDDDRTVHVTFKAAQGPHVRVRFEGDALPADRRADLVPIEREGSANEDLLEDATNRIEDYLRAQGYRDAGAPHARAEHDGELVITFTVTKGPLYRIAHVELSGNQAVSISGPRGEPPRARGAAVLGRAP